MYSKQERASIYHLYCAYVLLNADNKSETIRKANRLSYKIVFGNEHIRQRDMSEQQLDKITEHRLHMIRLMQAKVK